MKTTPLAAVEATVIVALPEVFVELSVMILGAVKFCPGVPKLQVGGETAPDGELLVRFAQLGAFMPFCRNHSAINTQLQEPWAFGEPYESAYRKAMMCNRDS